MIEATFLQLKTLESVPLAEICTQVQNIEGAADFMLALAAGTARTNLDEAGTITDHMREAMNLRRLAKKLRAVVEMRRSLEHRPAIERAGR